MVIDHAHSLHKGVYDGGADEAEAILFERFRHDLGNGRFRWNIFHFCPPILNGDTIHKLP